MTTTIPDIDLDNLPEPWNELRKLVKELKVARSIGDTDHLNALRIRVAKWRDEHPEEADAFMHHLTECVTSSHESL